MRWYVVPLVYALLLTLLAGCTTNDDGASGSPQTGADDEATGLVAFDGPGSAAHCQDVVAFFLRDPAFYQARLPGNYTTRDAKDLADNVGLPVPSGKAAAYVSGYECPTSDHANGAALEGGEVAILIQPPTLNGPGPDTPATLDFYLKNWHTNSTVHQALLDAYGIPWTDVSVTTGIGGLAPRHEGSVAVYTSGDDRDLLVAYSADGPEADPYTGLVRIWYESPNGITWTDLEFHDAPNGKGFVTDCHFQEGSIYAEVFGANDCTTDPGLALIFYDQSYGGGFHFRPGVRAVA